MLDHTNICLFGTGAKRNKTMLLQNKTANFRIHPVCISGRTSETKTGLNIGEITKLIAKLIANPRPAIRLIAQSKQRQRVRMKNIAVRKKRMQQRLN